MVPRYRNQCSD